MEVEVKMKVLPIKDYRKPSYPTIDEIGSADLSRLPVRWQKLKAVAASLGAAAMTLKAISLEAAEAAKPAKTEERGGVHPQPNGSALRAEKVTDICPLPPTKIAGDGRGAFGCVAVNPPMMLPEGEALDIIETEFRKRGIELVDGVEIRGGKAPPRGKAAKKYQQSMIDFLKTGTKYDPCSTSKGALMPLVKRNWRADLGTKDGKIVVEYVSGNDERVWNKSRLTGDGWCSVDSYDVRGAAERVVEGVAARTEGAPMTVGVFYDPMACLEDEESADDRETQEDNWAKCKAIATERLKAQIESFFRHLAKKNAPHPASH